MSTKEKPFFVKFLEGQEFPNVKTNIKAGVDDPGPITQKYPSDGDDDRTLKFPSDSDEGNA
jgi:hypothetical protein